MEQKAGSLYNDKTAMVAFGHTSVGVIIGVGAYQVLGQGDVAVGLIAAGTAGVVSHYLMDLMPHGHFFREKDFSRFINLTILLDLLIPILFFLITAHFIGKSPLEILYILFGIGGAQLPDIKGGLSRLDLLPNYKIFQGEHEFHMGTHWHGRGDKALLFNVRDIWQILMFVLAVLVLIKL